MTPERGARNITRRFAEYHNSTVWVRNLSLTGAAIEITDIPDKFTLFVPSDGLHLPVVWRKAYRIGVQFD
jgi:hypothetical protein